jgi:hypothetical protein
VNKEKAVPVFTNNEFLGHWPVGTAAVVTAATPERAAELLAAELATIGLEQRVHVSGMKPVELAQEAVVILCDGDY